jgi:hypothetical protein
MVRSLAHNRRSLNVLLRLYPVYCGAYHRHTGLFAVVDVIARCQTGQFELEGEVTTLDRHTLDVFHSSQA